MRLRYWIALCALAAYGLAWLGAWLRQRLAGDPRWMEAFHGALATLGRWNARIVLTVLYVAFLPFFAAFFFLRDPLDLRGRRRESFWREVKRVPPTPERYERPF